LKYGFLLFLLFLSEIPISSIHLRIFHRNCLYLVCSEFAIFSCKIRLYFYLLLFVKFMLKNLKGLLSFKKLLLSLDNFCIFRALIYSSIFSRFRLLLILLILVDFIKLTWSKWVSTFMLFDFLCYSFWIFPSLLILEHCWEYFLMNHFYFKIVPLRYQIYFLSMKSIKNY